MRTILRAIVLFLALAGSLLPAAAEDQMAKLTVAGRIVALTTSRAMSDSMMEAIWPVVRNSIVAQNPSTGPEVLDPLQRVMADLMREMVADMSDDVVAFYAKEFDLDELEAMEGFYNSPAGAKLLALQPRLMTQVMPGILSKSQEMLPRVMGEMQKAAEQRGLKFSI